MNKPELIEVVAAATGLTKKDVTRVIDETILSITQSLRSHEEVRLHGFGIFTVANTAAKTGRNPATGQQITVPASTRV